MIRLYCPSLASVLHRKQLRPKKDSEQAYLELYRLEPDHLEPGFPVPDVLGPGDLEPDGLEPGAPGPAGQPSCHKPGWQDYRFLRGDPPPDMDYGSRSPSHTPDVSH